jgi:CO/xanthine dehydrogenase FAD-binding subunit
MQPWQQYLQPSSIDQAIAALESAFPRGRVIAGGTDLLLDLQQGREPPVHTLVDISAIRELGELDVQDHVMYVGAAATHHAILRNEWIQQGARCLAEACGVIGGPQVRNVATLGGNVAHGLPAADGTIALLALEAEVEIANLDGRSWHPVESVFRGPGETSFDRRREILTRFRFPLAASREGSAFYRVMRPQGVAIAILNMACWLELEKDGVIGGARIAVGPTGPVPRRARKSEQRLLGSRFTAEDLDAVREALLAESKLRTSRHRATEAYRQHLIEVLVQRTLPLAYRRAEATASAGARRMMEREKGGMQ